MALLLAEEDRVYDERERQRPSFFVSGADGDLVVNKCGGLPIVIFAVAKYVHRISSDQKARFMAAVKDGKFIHELATNTQIEFVGLKGLLAWVDSDLRACPESLRLLILYMLNFSQEERVVVVQYALSRDTYKERVVVRRKRLVWRWIAEGYIKNTGICDMVTEAEERLRELEDLTMMMMQAPPGGEEKTWHRGYQFSGFCSEVLKSRAEEDALLLPLEVSALTKGEPRGLTSRGCAGRHLRIDGEWERNEFVFRSLDVSRLRSLTVRGKFEAFFINDSMKELRVLDLEDTYIENDDDDDELKEKEIPKLLPRLPKLVPRLRFLSLRGCREIDHLPDSIGDLRQLQTLDIRGTPITTLPSSILKLRNLRCLRAGYTMKAQMKGGPYVPWGRRIGSSWLSGLASCSWPTRTSYASRGVTVPRGMSRQLKALHTLGIVNVNTAGGEATLLELQHFQQLRKLELYGINSSNVQGLRHLRYIGLDSLSLGFTDDTGFASRSSCSDILSRLRTRRRLKLHGHVGILQVLPERFFPGCEITDLTLEIDISLTEDNMERIGKLRDLRSLRLHFHTGQEAGGKLMFDATTHLPRHFGRLKFLEISSLNTLLDVEFPPRPRAVETLEVLKFVGSLRSLKIPRGGLHVLPSLKEVWAEDPSLRHEMREVLEGHPNKPALLDFSSWQYQRDTEKL